MTGADRPRYQGARLDALSREVLAFSIHLACVPGTMTLNLKALARASGNRKVEMAEKDEIHRLFLAPQDLVRATQAKVASVGEESQT